MSAQGPLTAAHLDLLRWIAQEPRTKAEILVRVGKAPSTWHHSLTQRGGTATRLVRRRLIAESGSRGRRRLYAVTREGLDEIAAAAIRSAE